MKLPQIKNNTLLLVMLYFIICPTVSSQVGYQKDSIQIKVYTQIEYINNKVKNIEITKVFCDYCTDYQIEALEHEAYQRVAHEAYYPDYRVENGKRKQALNIRISRKDFAALKEEIQDDSVSNKKADK